MEGDSSLSQRPRPRTRRGSATTAARRRRKRSALPYFAKVVGLVFDGNIESLPGNYWFDEEVNRCVGVHAAIMVEALGKVYEEYGLVSELTGGK